MSAMTASNLRTPAVDDEQTGFDDDHKAPSRWVKIFAAVTILILILLLIADRLFNPAAFQIKEIEVHGQLQHVDGIKIKQLVESRLIGNYFSARLRRLEKEIEQIPGVFSVSLRRKWPSTIVAEVEEIQPVARWGGDQWLNYTGDLMDRRQMVQSAELNRLPVLHGPENQTQEVWKTFQFWSGQFARIGISLDELRLDSRALWHLKLSLGALSLNQREPAQTENAATAEAPEQVSMVLDSVNASTGIWRFIEALDQNLIKWFPEMKTIDLRYPNGFAIGWRTQESPVWSDRESVSQANHVTNQ